MPKVGKGQHFPYSPAGVDAAKKAAKASGKPLIVDPKKMMKGGKKK